jgi:hypothetical protein
LCLSFPSLSGHFVFLALFFLTFCHFCLSCGLPQGLNYGLPFLWFCFLFSLVVVARLSCFPVSRMLCPVFSNDFLTLFLINLVFCHEPLFHHEDSISHLFI